MHDQDAEKQMASSYEYIPPDRKYSYVGLDKAGLDEIDQLFQMGSIDPYAIRQIFQDHVIAY